MKHKFKVTLTGVYEVDSQFYSNDIPEDMAIEDSNLNWKFFVELFNIFGGKFKVEVIPYNDEDKINACEWINDNKKPDIGNF